jgi:hypothetical protein
MLIDRPPRGPALQEEFLASDGLRTLELPSDDRLCAAARAIEAGMKTGKAALVRQACTEFLTIAAEFYQVENPTVGTANSIFLLRQAKARRVAFTQESNPGLADRWQAKPPHSPTRS